MPGIADPLGPVQVARAANRFQLMLELGDLVLQDAPVRLDLRFAGTAEETGTAALPFEVGPAAHQPALLVVEVRKLDLEGAFLGPGALAENLENQPGAVEHLGVQFLLEIALLHRRQRVVDDDQLRLALLHDVGELRHLAAAEQRCRARVGDRHDRRVDRIEIDGAGKPDRLVVACVRRATQARAVRIVVAARLARKHRHNDNRPGRILGFRPELMSLSPANAAVRVLLTCQSGALAFLAIEHLNRLARHDRGNGVLVDELGMPVAPQQHTEIVERSDDSGQLHAVDEEDGKWIFALAN